MSLNDNFRRDLLKKVYGLARHQDIDGVTEKILDPKTLNSRFKNINQTMYSVFDAMADLASRDKKYMQSFFQGYVNPVYQKQHSYTMKDAYLTNKKFQSNGQYTTFPDGDRVVYDHSGYGNLETNDAYEWVFKNGVLMDTTQYDVANTPYGLKLYVKPAFVANDDRIDLVINKKFNNTAVWKYTFPSIQSNFNTQVVVNDNITGRLYHTKHMILYVRKVGHPNFLRIPVDRYVVAMDVSGTVLNITIQNYIFQVGDELCLKNSTEFWSKEVVQTMSPTNTCCTHSAIPLVRTDGSPVPFKNSSDFDVFYNNKKLLPEIHYGIAYSVSSESPDEMVLLFNAEPGTNTIKIFKNEPSFEQDSIVMNYDELPEKGFVQYDPNFRMPVMPKLGYCFINGKFVNDTHLSTKHRSLLQVSDVEDTHQFNYTMKIVTNQEVDDIIQGLESIPSEMDLVVEYMGLQSILDTIYATLPENNVSTNPNIEDEMHITGYTPNAAWYRMIYNYLNLMIVDANAPDMVFDANLELPVEFRYFDTDQVLDANECSCQDIIIDANIIYTP